MLLANGLTIFSIKGSGPKSLLGNPLYCTILCNWIFDNFILADEPFTKNKPFAKVLRSFETCVLVDKNLCRILFSLLEAPNTFDERFKVN